MCVCEDLVVTLSQDNQLIKKIANERAAAVGGGGHTQQRDGQRTWQKKK